MDEYSFFHRRTIRLYRVYVCHYELCIACARFFLPSFRRALCLCKVLRELIIVAVSNGAHTTRTQQHTQLTTVIFQARALWSTTHTTQTVGLPKSNWNVDVRRNESCACATVYWAAVFPRAHSRCTIHTQTWTTATHSRSSVVANTSAAFQMERGTGGKWQAAQSLSKALRHNTSYIERVHWKMVRPKGKWEAQTMPHWNDVNRMCVVRKKDWNVSII